MTRVKICGLTRLEDADLAVGLGAWALGMIMWPGSPRHCTPEQAAEIAAVNHRRAEIAGVFVDQKLDEVVRTTDDVGLSIVQLHGDEGKQYCLEVARRTGCKVIKAFRVRNRSVLTDFGKYRDVDWHLVDTYKAGVPGGTGETFDWAFLRDRRRGGVPLILSGGLNASNVRTAVETVEPWGVDVSGGVESEPGVKDHDAMREFFAQVRVATLSERARAERESEAEPAVTGVDDEVLTLAYARREAAELAAEREAERQAAARAAEREAESAVAAAELAHEPEPESDRESREPQ